MVQVSAKDQMPPVLAQIGVEVIVPEYPLPQAAETQMPMMSLVAERRPLPLQTYPEVGAKHIAARGAAGVTLALIRQGEIV